jgi:hypothetical protein
MPHPPLLDRRNLLRFGGAALLGLGLAACGDAESAEPTAPLAPGALHFPLVSGWYREQEARYYEFGANSRAAGNAVNTAPLWAFITGFNAAGVPQFVKRQHSVVSTNIGDPDYSDLWQIVLVTVPDGYEPDSIRSLAAVRESGFPTESGEMLVNCPFVPEGSTLAEGPDLVEGWIDGEKVFYPDFGPNPDVANAMYVLITGYDPDGAPLPVEGQGNLIDAIPGQAGYSAFWRQHHITVPAGYTANDIRSAAAVLTSGFPITVTDTVLNCPVHSPRE